MDEQKKSDEIAPLLDQAKQVVAAREQFQKQWIAGEQPRIEEYLERFGAIKKPLLLRQLVAKELELRKADGQNPNAAEYGIRFAEHQGIVTEVFGGNQMMEEDDPTPERLGRYEIQRRLGRGGFGVVYLAHDPQLDRPVAIKIPRRDRFDSKEQVEHFLKEACIAASLKHPSLVAVYDIQEEGGLPYIVQEFIEGQNLANWVSEKQPTFRQIAEVLISVANALGYLHQQGLVHADVKLANVLMDQADQPHVADFGLTLDEVAQLGHKGQVFGTPEMMSPEQVRGESHRFDGRTDIWAVGVMLYELLTRRKPFSGKNRHDLFAEIQIHDPRPPRQIDRAIPREIERICLKCLAKRRTDRYATTDDLRDDLTAWLREAPSTEVPQSAAHAPTVCATKPDSSGSAAHLMIFPKGLRSFDKEDADFFLELLPGPRDRDGLPQSIRFWKTRIEERDLDQTFSVGLIYGPSGCGKSSLMKAGLIPRLADHVLPIYVEATAEDTEVRILKQLHKHIPLLAAEATLPEVLGQLRTTGAGRDRKVLIVIDQAEQWLHAHSQLVNAPVVDALRQCEGSRLQAVLLVRDDFYLSVNRLFQELEIRLVEGQNQEVVDLFDTDHARKVLMAFGHAYGKLDDTLSAEQQKFVELAVNQLAEHHKVISVRLALFADMFKSRPWLPATLQEVGGVSGVGVTFLEETFSANSAPPSHRLHQRAISGVLNALLPEMGSDIKGSMQPTDQLQAAAGYRDRPRDFDELIQILDSEVRLITPTDREGVEGEEWSPQSTASKVKQPTSHDSSPITHHPSRTTRYYQLTHDYLVHSLRDWLTRKQRETKRGRAELLLADRSATWNAKPERRHLPSTLEWLRIQTLTHRSDWTVPQRKMMQRANRVTGVFWSGVFTLLIFAGIGVQQIRSSTAQENTRVAVDSLQATSGNAVPFVLENLDKLPRKFVLQEIQDRFPDAHGQQKLCLAYGLAHLGQIDFNSIIDGLMDEQTQNEEFANIVTALTDTKEQALENLKSSAHDATAKQEWQIKSRLAVVAMYLNDLSIAEEMLTATKPDPAQRTVFISTFPEMAFNIELLPEILGDLDNPHFRSGICLSLGGVERPAQAAKEAWKGTLKNWYLQSPDSGTHSAARWATNQWQLALPSVKETRTPASDRDWWHARGLRFVKIWSGSVQGEKEQINVPNDFWLSDTEITVGQFQCFIDDKKYTGLKPDDWPGATIFENDTSLDLPVQQVTWFDSVMFCNWLSQQLGLDPCYEIVVIEKTKEEHDPNKQYSVKLLATDGIRLPTVGEWEFGCRAGTTTKFSFGEKESWLDGYGWWYGNSNSQTHWVAAKRCNAWGLFDMHGNVWEWCWDIDPEEVSKRVIHGGSWYRSPKVCESANDSQHPPDDRDDVLGFRVLHSSFK